VASDLLLKADKALGMWSVKNRMSPKKGSDPAVLKNDVTEFIRQRK